MSDTVIRVENLGKKYIIGHQKQQPYKTLRESMGEGIKSLTSGLFKPFSQQIINPAYEEFWALKEVSFEIKQGEVVGIIGRNGAGKSTLLKILSRITEPTKGRLLIKGQVASLLEVGTGFHPELTGRENIHLNGAILGMSKAEIKKKFDEIVAFAEIEKFLDTPVKRYSSGMYVRLAFAVAAHLEPKILVVDEVLAVGDAAFQKKCLGKMGDVAQKEGRTVLFVSHNMAAIRRLCDRGLWLETGKLKLFGDAKDCLDAYTNTLEASSEMDAGYFKLSERIDRLGNGKARFLTVELLDKDGVRKSNFDFYEPFSIKFEIECQEWIKPCYVGFAILSSDGTVIFASHHSDFAELKQLDQGQYTIACLVNPNQLKPGKYWLSIGIGDFSSWEPIDWFPNGIGSFTIDSGSGKFASHLDGRSGYLQPLLQWEWL